MADAIATARSFHERFRASSDELEQSRRMPAELASDMAAAGMFRLLVPKQHLPVHGEAVILCRDLYAATVEIQNRLVRTAVPELELKCPGAAS